MRHCITSILVGLIFCSTVFAAAQWQNCGTTEPWFTEFTVFPDRAVVGDTIYFRAVVAPPKMIPDGRVHLSIYRNETDPSEPIIVIPSIPLCNMSSSIRCPIQEGPNIYSWTFVVPEIPSGTYFVRYQITPSFANVGQGCLVFGMQIAPNTTESATFYRSWYSATLYGKNNFEHERVDDRTTDDWLQVGPIGDQPKSVAGGFAYGTFGSVVGSGDLVPAGGLMTDGFVWGLWGNMTKIEQSNTTLKHTYEGHFYVGYKPGFLTYDHSLFSGNFLLTWTWNADRSQAKISGYFNTSESETLPSGWPSPILFGRLQSNITMDSNGRLVAQGSEILCLSGTECDTSSPGNSRAGPGKDSFTNTELGVTIGVILGFAFLVVLLVAFLTWRKNKRESEEEDGVFAVARKPEYGSALILDDIIQETQGKNRDLRPMLDPRRRAEAEDSLSEDDDLGYAAPDSYSISASEASRSRSRRAPPQYPHHRNQHQTTTMETEGEEDEDESRSRSPISRSPVGRRRGRSTSGSRSRSPKGRRSRSHSRDSHGDQDSESAHEEDPGSSASRVSDDDSDE